MKIKIIKSLISVYGVMTPGMVITVPEHIALNWIRNGIAECEGNAEAKAEAKRKAKAEGKPEVIPSGMFWCDKHNTLHRLTSSQGKKCQKRIAGEEEAKAEAEAAEAEAKARAEEAEDAGNDSNDPEQEPEPE